MILLNKFINGEQVYARDILIANTLGNSDPYWPAYDINSIQAHKSALSELRSDLLKVVKGYNIKYVHRDYGDTSNKTYYIICKCGNVLVIQVEAYSFLRITDGLHVLRYGI